MEIHRGIARLFCVLLVCRAVETLAGSTALRRARPTLAVEPTHHRALVGSRTVKEERPGLMEHMAAARKRRDVAHPKATTNLDADVSTEVVNMQEADRVAEDVLKNLDTDTADKDLDTDTADEDDQDEEKDDTTSVDSPSASSIVSSKASKVEAGQTWAEAQRKWAVDASAHMEVKSSVSDAHVEKLTRQIEGVKKTWATAQEEVKKLHDSIPRKIGGEVAKLQAKSAENPGSNEDDEESLYKWAKGEADKVAGTVSKTSSWSAADNVAGKAVSTEQDSKTQQEQDKAEDAIRDSDDEDDATEVEDQKDQTSAQADAVIAKIKSRIVAANAAADAKVAAEKAAAKKAAAEKIAAEEKAEAQKKAKAQEAAKKAAEKVAEEAAMKVAAEKAAAEKAAAEKAAAEKAAAEKAMAEKAAAEKAAADKAASQRKAAEKKAAAQNAEAAKKAVVEKTDAAAAVTVKDEDGDDDDDNDNHQAIAPAVHHTPAPAQAQDTLTAAPTILAPEPVNLAIGGARAVSDTSAGMSSDSPPSVQVLDTQEEPSVESDGAAPQVAHQRPSHDDAWFEEDAGDTQPSSEEVTEATESSQDSEGNVGWTDDELAEQETEEEDLSASTEGDPGLEEDEASESESSSEDTGYEDQEEHEEQVSEDEDGGEESEADIEEDVEEALLQMQSRRNLRRVSP